MPRSRWRRAAAALVLLAVAWPASTAAAQLPDLEQIAPYDARVVKRDGDWYLGFATAVRNVGDGALRIRGQRSGAGDMAARQVSEDGLADLTQQIGVLRYITSYGHSHWHFMGFMRYELRGLDVPGVLLDRKQGFCVSEPTFGPLRCGLDLPDLAAIDVGLRAGAKEVYEPNVEGQEIRIGPDSTPSGRYLLVSRIGPTGLVSELRTDNNVATTIIELRWPLAHGQPVPLLGSCVGEGCAGPVPPARTIPPAMTAADARRLASRAVRRELVPAEGALRPRCRRTGASAHTCHARLASGRRSFRATVRVSYAIEGAAVRWRYSLVAVRTVRGCRSGSGCVRTIRRPERVGGTVGE